MPMKPGLAIQQDDFRYYECPVCQFDVVLKKPIETHPYCPICAEDNGRDVRLNSRACLSTDEPEGRDDRKEA